ncbi:MAG: DUF1080 domain-containing protein [Cyclobacteriaceae bacterium]
MKKYSIIVVAALILCLTSNANSQQIDLFNGKNLDGWVIENGGQFSVADGVIKLNKGTGWLRSEKKYSDFVMTMEFRFMEKESNSGIYVRIPSNKEGENDGWPASYYQMQCKDDTTTVASHLGHMLFGGVPDFDFISSHENIKKAYKPVGEWHTYEITCKKGTLVARLNGEIITIAMNVQTPEGYVGIQGEHGTLEFRKIAVEIL